MDKIKRSLRDAIGPEKYMFLVKRRDDLRDGIVSLARNVLRKLEGRPGSVCLITGPPRSGTTAVRRWLGSHSDVIAFHESRLLIGVNSFYKEVKYFKKLRRSQGMISCLLRELALRIYSEKARPKRFSDKKIVLDKEPLEPKAFPDQNYAEFLQNMREIYPGMKLIYMIRDPEATIWSMRQRKWGYSTTDSEVHKFEIEDHVENWNTCADIARNYSGDRNAFICSFNRLVRNPVVVSQEILYFLGLDMHGSFQPRPTKNPNFSAEEAAFIAEKTDRRWEVLNEEVFS